VNPSWAVMCVTIRITFDHQPTAFGGRQVLAQQLQ